MKQLQIFLLLILFSKLTYAQEGVFPSKDNEYCPLTEYTFTVTIPGTYSSMIGAGGCYVTVAPNPNNFTTSGSNTIFDFKGKFADVNAAQTFTVYYTTTSGSATYNIVFKKIKSLFYYFTSNDCPYIQPNTTVITATRCQVANFNINFANIKYRTQSENLCFSSITNYEYQLPQGWKIGTSFTSTGSNWYAGGNNVTVTSDATHGDGGSIAIRPINTACGSGLTPGSVVAIAISRPAPTLTISGLANLCSGATSYSITGVPATASVVWSIDNTNLATLTGGTTTTPTLTAATGASGDVQLTATVTDCSFTYTKTYTVTIGAGEAPVIWVHNVDYNCGKFAEAYCTNPSNSNGFIWNFNFGQVIQNNSGYYGNYFLLNPLGQNQTGQTYYDYLSVQATNVCGTSLSSAVLQFTVGPISSNCGGGRGGGVLLKTNPTKITSLSSDVFAKEQYNIKIYPNPASNIITVTLPTSINTSKAVIRVTDIFGREVKKVNASSSITNITATNLAKGTYLITIYEGDNKISTQKIIKN